MIGSTTLIGVLVGFTLLGIILGRMTSKDSVDDFALGGRSLGFFPSLMTLSGTFVSAVTLMVYTSFVYIYGISAAWIFIGYTLGFLLFIPFALKLYRLSIEHKFFTLTDYFVFRYGRKTARWVIGVIFVWYVGLLSTQLLVGSNLLNELGGIAVNWAKLGMLLCVMVYLLVGGFGSVVKTDMFQFLVIFLVLILVTLTLQKGGDVPPEMYAPFNAGPVNIVAFLLLGILTPFATQDYWQKVFAMKNEKVVKQSFGVGAGVNILLTVALTYVGLIARAQFPAGAGVSNEHAEMMVLRTFTELVPPEFQVAVLIAFFAAILSTSDTYLFLLSLNVTNDLFPNKEESAGAGIKRIRWALVGVGFFALLIALFFQRIEDIVVTFKALGIGIAPVIFYDWAGKHDKRSVVWSLLVMTVLSLGVSIYMIVEQGKINPAIAFVSIGTSSIVYGISFLFRKKKRTVE
ncbi:sodium:solute symporter family protein [Schleiferiaceae bacterium]|jgi:Na+/proline symporter|nr:sodium:solute symporter family protein [Schleiferiaceae bacterium]